MSPNQIDTPIVAVEFGTMDKQRLSVRELMRRMLSLRLLDKGQRVQQRDGPLVGACYTGHSEPETSLWHGKRESVPE